MSTKQKDFVFGIILTHLFIPKGETIRALMIPFWRFMPKGERERAQSKRTAPPPISKKTSCFQRILSIGILLCSKGGESSISKMIYQNPLEH
jgi:hypothetical protein